VSDRIERVRAVLAAGRRIANAADPLGREARQRLPDASGLSPQGVELALQHHFEVDASDEELEALVRSQSSAPHCHLVLAANVCTAALRAYACGAAVATELSVRASSRDPVVAELLARALAGSDALSITMVEQLAVDTGDDVHAYGADETLAKIAELLPSGARLVAHGTGIGVALIEPDVDIHQAAERLADDLVPFDGRGCLSPRFVLVHPCDHGRAEAFSRTLDGVLRDRGDEIPRGPLDDNSRAEISRYRHLIDTIGTFIDAPHHAVAFDPAPTTLALPPALRSPLVVACDEAQLQALIQPWLRYLTAIGQSGAGPLGAALRELAPNARVSALGQMQNPPLDGPVDRRQLEKLLRA